LCGGFSGALALDDLAAKYGVKTTPQCFSTSIVQAATLQFAAARPNVACAEYHCFHDHLTHLYRDSAGSIAQGYASAGNSPGLGIDIPATGLHSDTSVISPYKVFE
jgi:L-alanine-DL-glutamate epimerase-like enolase superfamily enzyme